MVVDNKNIKEIEKFSNLSQHWWDEKGIFSSLHKLTVPRVDFILGHLEKTFSKNKKNIKILDVGCGGGLVCEPFSRLGYTVTGIDASYKSIEAAKKHAQDKGLSIEYIHQELSDFKKTRKKVDVVFLLELLEHVPDPKALIQESLSCLKKGGVVFFSTLNRTWKSYILGIHIAEKILKWAPRGAHSYEKFLKPSQIQYYFEDKSFSIKDIKGITFDILKGEWILTEDISINYIGFAQRTF